MGVKKNTAGKWVVFAWTTSTGLGKTGDAAQITANVRIDGGAANAVDDTNPTELEDGYYVFDITAAEFNGTNIVICPQSSTSGVQVIGVPGAVWTEAGTDQTGDGYAIVNNGTYGNSAIETLVDDLESRLTATRAGYLDNLSAGAVALASELAKVPKSDGSTSWNATALAAILTQAAAAITAAEPIDANITKINNTTVTGDGDATPWGPA